MNNRRAPIIQYIGANFGDGARLINFSELSVSVFLGISRPNCFNIFLLIGYTPGLKVVSIKWSSMLGRVCMSTPRIDTSTPRKIEICVLLNLINDTLFLLLSFIIILFISSRLGINDQSGRKDDRLSGQWKIWLLRLDDTITRGRVKQKGWSTTGTNETMSLVCVCFEKLRLVNPLVGIILWNYFERVLNTNKILLYRLKLKDFQISCLNQVMSF